MNALLETDMLQDELAVSLARAVAAANQRANELGLDVRQSIVTISQVTEGEPHWRINYGMKDYVGRRGGDIIIDVDATDASIKQVLRGQ